MKRGPLRYLKNARDHFATITQHKKLVMEACFAMGLYRQGLLHDLSKFSPTEFLVGVRYFQGDRSPNNAEREATGKSLAWLHHKGRNKHHLEYWIDYNLDKTNKEMPLCGTQMPIEFVVEMFADRIAACKTYQKDAYTDRSPWEYYQKGRDHYLLHEKTRRQLEFMLKMLASLGEDVTFDYIRKEVLKKRLTRKLEHFWFRIDRKVHHSPSISVGGADGPTSIFFAGKLGK